MTTDGLHANRVEPAAIRMSDAPAEDAETAPIASNRRIGALDLARGFALLGILLINVQAFNLSRLPRPDGGHRLEPLDGIVQWLLAAFVENKFWALFSILFGMGFAVMLERAGADRRGFVARYLRRASALALFGVLHIVLIWSGDILFNYAVTAMLLLAILFCGPWLGLALGVAAVAVARLLGLNAGDMLLLGTYSATVALYLRVAGPDRRKTLAICIAAAVLAIAGMAVYGSATPAEARKAAGYAIALAVAGGVALFDRSADARRLLRAGVWLFMAPVLASAIASALAQWTPAAFWPAATPASEAKPMQRRAELRARGLAENKAMAEGSYADGVRFRMSNGFKRPIDTVFVLSLAAGGLFLIGMWLVRSGAARWPERHSRLWRGLAWVGFPVGAISVIGGERLIEAASGSKPAAALLSVLPEAGAILMALGYLAFAFLLAGKSAAGGPLSWVASTGRMALTNYLMQSVLATFFFYGYGLGFWGLGRTWQAVFVLAVFALQVLLSRWWLSDHRYGPMEWLWRWITYARKPTMRMTHGDAPSVRVTSSP